MDREHQFDGSPGSLGSDPYGLTSVLEGCAKTAAVDPALESDETLMSAAVALERAREDVETALARVLGRLDTTAATDVAVGMRPGAWLAWEADTNISKCRHRASVAKRLGWFSEFTEALGVGQVLFHHAEVLASVANRRNRDGLRTAQQVLIEWAQRFRFEQWAAMVRQLATDLDADGAFDPNDDPARNRLRLRDNRNGTIDITGLLNATSAVTVTQGLDAIADELAIGHSHDRDHDPDLPIPTRSQLLAEALTEAVRRARAVDVNTSRPPRIEATIIIEEDPEPHCHAGSSGGESAASESATRDDAASDAAPGGGGRSGPPRIRVRDLSGRIVATGTADALLVDADMRAFILDADGNPLWLGDKVRFATPAQKHALAVRDGGCIFPGCDMPPQWCDAHHQPGWKPDGRTDIDKMFLACRRHHGVTHRRGWTCEPDPQRPQHWIWTTPTGRRLHSQRQHRQPH